MKKLYRQYRYMQMQAFALINATQANPLLSLSTQAASLMPCRNYSGIYTSLTDMATPLGAGIDLG